MRLLGVVVRLLMLLVCLVPFTSARQASGVFAQHIPLTAAGPTSEVPFGEEDDERETTAKERIAAQARHRPSALEQVATLPQLKAAVGPSLVRTTPLCPLDPFRNGLGSPYRC